MMIKKSRIKPIFSAEYPDPFPWLRTGLFLLFFQFLLLHPVYSREKQVRFGTIKQKGEILVFDFDAGDLMNDQVFRGLRRGMTAAVEYQVQVYRVNPHWMDQMVHETIIRLKVHYDNWEKKYAVELGKDNPHWLDENSVRSRCSRLEDFPAGPVDKLQDSAGYYITLRILLKPMSVENYQEISQWLTGEVKELNPKAIQSTKSTGKKAGNWLLGLVLNLTGFGDRIVSAKSRPFAWQEGLIIQEEEPLQ